MTTKPSFPNQHTKTLVRWLVSVLVALSRNEFGNLMRISLYFCRGAVSDPPTCRLPPKPFLLIQPCALTSLRFAFSISCNLPLETCNYYFLGLLSVCATNQFPTICQHPQQSGSFKMVNAISAKELQNVLPKCNPFHHHIEYYNYGVVGVCRWQTLAASTHCTLTSPISHMAE